MGNSRLYYQFDGLLASSLTPSLPLSPFHQVRYLKFVTACFFSISTSVSADDFVVQPDGVVFRSISLMGLTSSPPSTPSLPLSPFHQVRYLKFDLTTCFSSKSSVHQHLLTFL